MTFTPSIGNGNTTRFRTETKIVRPPVVLVHGVWSKAGAWGGDYSKDTPYRSTYAADYSATNGARFSTNATRIKDFVANGLKLARDKGYAATQADVLGHSMGGILTRLYVAGNTFKRPDNYGQGDIRRLVTLDTPHSGSTFGNLVAGLHSLKPAATVAAVRSITDFSPAGGAVCDLAENSPALKDLNTATTIKAQAITGTGGPGGTTAVPARFFGGLLGFGNIEGELTKKVCVRRNQFFLCEQEDFVFPQSVVDAFRFRAANDTIVSLISQQGGHCSVAGLTGVNFSDVIHSGPSAVNGVLSSGTVAARAYKLLDGPTSDFVDSFPGVASDGLGAACTVPGRGATQDALDYAGQCGATGGLNRLSSGRPLQGSRPAASVADNRLQVIAPVDGQVFAPGDTIAITVRLTPPLLANDIGVQIPGFNSLTGSNYDGATYQASFKVPDFFAGPLQLIPAITDTANAPLEGPSITVAVRSSVPPTGLAFQQRNSRLGLNAVGSNGSLAVVGTFANGLQRDLSTAASGTAYSSSDSSVVAVDANGTWQVVSAGTAVITAQNGGLRDYAIFVVEDPANPLAPSEVTARLAVQPSGLRLDRTTGFYVQTIAVTNRQTTPITGPLVLALSGLPAGVNLVNQSGLTQNLLAGTPYLSLPLNTDGLTLRPGETVVLTAQYLNPGRVGFGGLASIWRVSAQP